MLIAAAAISAIALIAAGMLGAKRQASRERLANGLGTRVGNSSPPPR